MTEEKQEKQLSEETLALADYQLRERIEKRLWERIRLIGTIVSIGLTLLGVLGFHSFVEIIAEDVREEVEKSALSKVEFLRDELNKDLGDLSRRRAVLEVHASEAQKELKRLQAGNSQLEEVSNQYADTLQQLKDHVQESERLAAQHEKLKNELDTVRSNVTQVSETEEVVRRTTGQLEQYLGGIQPGDVSGLRQELRHQLDAYRHFAENLLRCMNRATVDILSARLAGKSGDDLVKLFEGSRNNMRACRVDRLLLEPGYTMMACCPALDEDELTAQEKALTQPEFRLARGLEMIWKDYYRK